MSEMTETETPESWEVAINYSALLGTPPSSFSSAIRSLLLDEERNKGQLSPGVRAAVLRLMNSPSMRVSVHFAALELFPQKFAGQSELRSEALIAPFRPFELATLLGLVYLFRRARKLADPEEWALVQSGMVRAVELGALVGIAIPKIGFATGMFAGGLHTLALITFHLHDRKGFKEYRRHLKSKALFFDGNYEMQRWGCTSPQVGGLLIQNLGFGMTLARAFAHSLIHRSSMASGGARASEVTDSHRGFLVAFDWIDSLAKTGQPAETVHDARYYPLQAAREQLLSSVQQLTTGAARVSWLAATKEDLPGAESSKVAGEDAGPTEELE